MKFNQVNNKIEIDFNKKMSKRQKQYFIDLLKTQPEDAASYALTFLGKRTRLDRPKFDRYERTESQYKQLRQTILDQYRVCSDSKKPYRTDVFDFIGVEIECLVPEDYVSINYFDSEVECETCSGSGNNPDDTPCFHCDGNGTIQNDDTEEESRDYDKLIYAIKKAKIKGVSVKDDGSLQDERGYRGCEITCLTRISDMSNLEKLCKFLNKIGARVNNSCGLHVHLDMRHKNKLQALTIGQKITKTLPLLASIVPKSRRNNIYCKLACSEIADNKPRYFAVNLQAYNRFKTIEIRLHSATTSFEKISNWILLLDKISNISRRIRNKISTLNELTDYVYIPENMLEYFSQRIVLFSDNEKESVNDDFRDNDNLDEVA